MDQFGQLCGLRWAGRKVQLQKLAYTLYTQRAAHRLQIDPVSRMPEPVKEYKGGGQGSVSAEIDLVLRGKPANVEGAAGQFYEKDGLGQVVFNGDLLQQLIGEPFIEGADRCRIASEESVGESVHRERS